MTAAFRQEHSRWKNLPQAVTGRSDTGGMELIYWKISPQILREDAGSSAIGYSAIRGIAGRTALQGSAVTAGWSSPALTVISWLLASEIRKRLDFTTIIWLVDALTSACSATGNLISEKGQTRLFWQCGNPCTCWGACTCSLGNSEKKPRGTVIQGRPMSSFAALLSVKHYCARSLPPAAAAEPWPVEEGEDRIHRASWQGGLANPAQLCLERQSPALKTVPCHPGSGRDWFWTEVSLGCWGQKFLPDDLSTIYNTDKNGSTWPDLKVKLLKDLQKHSGFPKPELWVGHSHASVLMILFNRSCVGFALWRSSQSSICTNHSLLSWGKKKKISKEKQHLGHKPTIFDSPWIKKC